MFEHQCSTMKATIDVLIIGGGLAGLTSAIHLSKAGKRVVLIEKDSYPHHKVCGEYVSNEVIPYLQWLNADPALLKPTQITRLQLTSASGKCTECALPLGGFGISRSTFDEFLSKKAKDNGCTILQDTVTNVIFEQDVFTVSTVGHYYQAAIVLGAYGKRAALDHALERSFMKKKSPWLAVKAHYKGDFPPDLVALHTFTGGYCGVSKVEDDRINICYLVNYASFKRYKSIDEHRIKVLYKNNHVKNVFENSTMLFNAPISISQLSFDNKERVKKHMLMIGDTAGLIHPLCGNGMAMAIHGAKICATLLINYFDGNIASRAALEHQYKEQWKKNFNARLGMGRLLAAVLRKEKCARLLMESFVRFPGILPSIISKTHGKPFITET